MLYSHGCHVWNTVNIGMFGGEWPAAHSCCVSTLGSENWSQTCHIHTFLMAIYIETLERHITCFFV